MSNNHLLFHEQWNLLKYIFDEDIVLDTNEKIKLYSIVYNMCWARSPNNHTIELYDNVIIEIQKVKNKERLRRYNNLGSHETFKKLRKTILFIFKPLDIYIEHHKGIHLQEMFEFNTVIEI